MLFLYFSFLFHKCRPNMSKIIPESSNSKTNIFSQHESIESSLLQIDESSLRRLVMCEVYRYLSEQPKNYCNAPVRT